MSTTSSGTPAPKYISWSQVEREHLNPLVDREMVYGQQLMLARVFLKKDGHVPLHHHHNEQLTYILEGALKFAIDGKEIVVRAASSLRPAPTGSTRPTTIFVTGAKFCGVQSVFRSEPRTVRRSPRALPGIGFLPVIHESP